MKISEIFTYFTDTIFRRDIREWRNPVIRWLVQQYRLLFYTARGLLEHGTIVRSAALTFYTLMSNSGEFLTHSRPEVLPMSGIRESMSGEQSSSRTSLRPSPERRSGSA